MTITRRRFLRLASLSTASLAFAPLLHAAEGSGLNAKYKRIGKVAAVPGREIKASPLSVGFEVLDRQRFDPTRTYEYVANLGVKWARCQTGWCRCETVKGEYDFAWLDEIVDTLLEGGVTPWFNLGYGNRLYTPEAPDEFAVGWAPIFSDDALAGWLRFTENLAQHFKNRVKHWEIWNEPNITHFWQPEKPNPEHYARLVAKTAPVIREQIPDCFLIGGALAGVRADYLIGCFEANLGDYVDAISYHPYRAIPEKGYDSDVKALREAIAKHAPGLKLWQGENGCPSESGEESVGALSTLQWDETRQAKWLLRRILLDLRYGVDLTSYFHTVDLVGYRGKTNFKGLLRGSDYTPKPSYFAYQCLCALFDAETEHAERVLELIDQEKVHLQEAHFTRNGKAIYAYWYPADLQKPWESRTVSMSLATRDEAALDDTVLVDPFSQGIFRLEPARREAGKVVFEDVPLLDYPLLITDAQAVGLA